MNDRKETALTVQETPPETQHKQAERKMTIYEYEDKYVHRENRKSARFFVRFFAAVIGIFLLAVLALLSMKAWEIHMYAGIGAAAVSVLAYILLFLVPVVKLFKTGYFITNVNSHSARAAQKHNRELRHQIADKFIDFNASVDGIGWYDDKLVGELAVALHTKNEQNLKETLSKLYAKSVKKTGKDIITKASLKAGMYSALSQSELIDAALVATVNLQLVKDIVFLYGFRPSDAKLVKILWKVISNSLIAYGMGSVNIGNGIVKTMGDIVKSVPILGSAISVLIDSSVQGLTNAVLTAVIGYQTIYYLNKEYKLQDILDGVEIVCNDELEETCEEVELELKKAAKKAARATA